MELEEAIEKINGSDDPLSAFREVSQVYDQSDADIVLPWLEEMAALRETVD